VSDTFADPFPPLMVSDTAFEFRPGSAFVVSDTALSAGTGAASKGDPLASGRQIAVSHTWVAAAAFPGRRAAQARMTNPTPARISATPTTRLKSDSWLAM
jgi:hypothetical protein